MNLIAKRIEHIKLPSETKIAICAITGQTTECIPFKSLFGTSFTNRDILADPNSDFVGVDVYQAIKYKYQRCSSWIVTESQFIRLGKSTDGGKWREKILHYIFEPPKQIWSGYITTSYKKHGALKTPINTNGKNIWLFENNLVDCGDNKKVIEYWNMLNMVLRQGVSRTILESLQCPAFVMKKVGLKNWLHFEKWAKDKHKSVLYSFLCYLLPSQEELKRENMSD